MVGFRPPRDLLRFSIAPNSGSILDMRRPSIHDHGKGFLRDDPVRRQPNDRVQTLTSGGGRHAVNNRNHRTATLSSCGPARCADHSSMFASTKIMMPTRACCRLHAGAISRPSHLGGRVRRTKQVVVICQRGQKLSQGVAAWLRHEGVAAESLEGGFEAWREAKGLLIKADKMPGRDDKGRTIWVTRARPKVDRIACPWLIRRFIDPSAVFLFVDRPKCGGRRSLPRQFRSTSTTCSGAIAASAAHSTR